MIEDVLETIDVGIMVFDRQGRLILINAALERLFGVGRDAIQGLTRQAFVDRLPPAIREEMKSDGGECKLSFNGEERWLAYRMLPLETGSEAGGRIELYEDVTERKRVSIAGEVGAWDWNLDTDEFVVDPTLKRMLGYEPSEIKNTIEDWGRLVHPEDGERVFRAAQDHIEGRSSRYEVAHRMIHKDGTVRWFLARGSVVRDEEGRPIRLAGTDTNITEQKRAEESIRRSLAEKETLLSEVHHRVKNNLQIVSSLLHMQARHLRDERDRLLVRDSQDRIRSMALVHEMLYATAGLEQIDVAAYVRKLAGSLCASYQDVAQQIEVSIHVDDVALSLDTAVHLGLILNELISNSLKHGFPGGTKGRIQVRLERDDDRLHIEVKDDGVGLPDSAELECTPTLGFQLVKAVTTQLGASVEFETSGGTVVRISVPMQGGKWSSQPF